MLRDTDGGSPWLYTGLGGSITYNPDNNTNKTAMIGTTSVPSNAGKARFYIESPSTEPQIALGTSGSSNVMNVTSKNYCIRISESKSGNVSDYSVGIGYKAEADGSNSIALGSNAKAINSSAIALGTSTNASAPCATALGYGAKVSSSYATALGYVANASRSSATALGSSANASSGSATALGSSANASSGSATALGASANASGDSATALGYSTKASSSYATAIGNSANASGYGSIALGYLSKAGGGSSTALGPMSTASGFYSAALATSSNASGSYSISLGYNSKTSGRYSTALGYNSNATQSYAMALGASSSATHSYSTAVGYGATTSASSQIVLGTSSTTVYIPGNLVVGRNALLNAQRGDTALRRGNGGELCVVRSEDLKGGDDNLRRYPTDIDDKSFFDSYISDRRLKNVGEVFSGGLDKIKQLKVYNFTFKDDESKTPHVGVMAQDLQKVFPDAVTKGKDGFLRIRWEDMFCSLINAVKELDLRITAENTELKKRVTELEKQNKRLEERLSKLEKKIL